MNAKLKVLKRTSNSKTVTRTIRFVSAQASKYKFHLLTEESCTLRKGTIRKQPKWSELDTEQVFKACNYKLLPSIRNLL